MVKKPTRLSDPAARPPPLTEQEYVIQPGDQLDIKFYYNSELNEQVTVRPDGRISLQLANETAAAGKTPAELTQLLTEKYSRDLKKPEITVIVRSFSALKVFVGGEVNRPGILDLTRPM
ncbi:MAG: sugar transporter, partial [Candidatus Latescibacteria bacterium]|nr:sugar transporter [Candidatus Latescibacterota bacterium]